jgi:hypothetical protein
VGYVLRAVMAGISVIVASVTGVVTALVTAHPSRGLWVALGVVVAVGGLLQVVVSYRDNGRTGQAQASGPGAVAIGGSAGKIMTHVSGTYAPPSAAERSYGVLASGPGSVSVGGDATGAISTEFTSDEEPSAS